MWEPATETAGAIMEEVEVAAEKAATAAKHQIAQALICVSDNEWPDLKARNCPHVLKYQSIYGIEV